MIRTCYDAPTVIDITMTARRCNYLHIICDVNCLRLLLLRRRRRLNTIHRNRRMILPLWSCRGLSKNRCRFQGVEDRSDLNVIFDRCRRFHICTLRHFATIDLRNLNVSDLARHIYRRLNNFFAISFCGWFLLRRLLHS